MECRSRGNDQVLIWMMDIFPKLMTLENQEWSLWQRIVFEKVIHADLANEPSTFTIFIERSCGKIRWSWDFPPSASPPKGNLPDIYLAEISNKTCSRSQRSHWSRFVQHRLSIVTPNSLQMRRQLNTHVRYMLKAIPSLLEENLQIFFVRFQY